MMQTDYPFTVDELERAIYAHPVGAIKVDVGLLEQLIHATEDVRELKEQLQDAHQENDRLTDKILELHAELDVLEN